MQESNIAWTDETWNPVHGCSKVSAGCENCYAERISRQYNHTEHPWTAKHASENVTERPDKLEEPFNLDEPTRVFVNSMSDLFHSEVSDSFIEQVFSVMRSTPEHIYQILTKRPGRAAQMDLQWPPNVWMGTSVEDERVTERLDLLRPCEADVLFVSFEPLIGPVGDIDLSGYDWVIVGGESGPDYREMSHEWVWPIRDAAWEYDCAFFFKQSAAYQNESEPYLREEDGCRTTYRELPEPSMAVERARKNPVVTDGGTLVNESEEGLPVALPETWTDWPEEAKTEYLETRLTKDELYNAVVDQSGISPKTNTAASPFQKHHLVELLLHFRQLNAKIDELDEITDRLVEPHHGVEISPQADDIERVQELVDDIVGDDVC